MTRVLYRLEDGRVVVSLIEARESGLEFDTVFYEQNVMSTLNEEEIRETMYASIKGYCTGN